MDVSRLTLHHISVSDSEYLDHLGRRFDTDGYSRFKYGCMAKASLYAQRLSDLVQSEYSHWKGEEVAVTGSAFKVAPTASWAIAGYLYEYLRPTFPRLKQLKIDRESIFPNDYGSLSMAERAQLMEQNRIRVDIDALKGRRLIVVDDLRVTGAHERKIIEVMDGAVGHLLFVYVGELTSDCLPDAEAKINHAAVRSIYDLLEIIRCGNFSINARVCKYILSYPNREELLDFLWLLPANLIAALHLYICGDEYHLMPPYASNFSLLDAVMKESVENASEPLMWP